MNLHEYQAKDLLKKYNVPVQEGIACSTVDEAVAAYEQIKEKIQNHGTRLFPMDLYPERAFLRLKKHWKREPSFATCFQMQHK